MKISQDELDCLTEFKTQVDQARLVLGRYIQYLYQKHKLAATDQINLETGEIARVMPEDGVLVTEERA